MAAILRAERLGWILFAVAALVTAAAIMLLWRLAWSRKRAVWVAAPLLIHPGWWMGARSGDCGRDLTLGSYVGVMGEAGDFLELAGGGFVFARHVTSSEDFIEPDYVFTAGRMLSAPYLWGGRTPLGLDCSSLVQLALEMAGVEAPRDVDQQRELFGQPLESNWRDVIWRRGDIVFFEPQHVGIMTSHDHIINANETVMQVTVEPLTNIVSRNYQIMAKGRP